MSCEFLKLYRIVRLQLFWNRSFGFVKGAWIAFIEMVTVNSLNGDVLEHGLL